MLLLKNFFLLGSSFTSLLLFLACNSTTSKKDFKDSDMYALSNPVVINLPTELDEISGIAYYPKDTSLFAIVDEDGLLFKIPIMNPALTKRWSFGKSRDYEDLVMADSLFYVLVSNGDVYEIWFTHDSINTLKLDFSAGSKKINEFESLYQADSARIVIMCKECDDDKKDRISSFAFNRHDSLKSLTTSLIVDMASIGEKIGLETKLKPSAAAVNPVTGELYIISAINEILIITDRNGLFKASYKLNPALYKQPEGMAFTPAGDLIISNEYAETGHATLLILKNKKKGR